MLITPGGRPASFRISIRKWLTSSVCVAGLNTTVLPMSAAAVGRLAPMDVKLKGLTANTKPSRGLYSRRFQAGSSFGGGLGIRLGPENALLLHEYTPFQAAPLSPSLSRFVLPTISAGL